MLTRCLSALGPLLFFLLGAPRPAAHGQTERTPAPETLRFPSGGTRIRVNRYAPAAGVRRRPAVLVLHGAGGTLLDGPEMRRAARALAGAGHPAYVIHYFNRTGTLVARNAILYQHYADWLPTVRDAVAFVHDREEGGGPVGIYGYSLGAFLAVAVAGDDPRVGAIVEQAGGVWENREDRLGRRMPPALMVHGREDQRVPFAKYAVTLEGFLRQRGTVVETRYVPGEGHVFSAAAQAGVRAATVDFFARRLGSPAQGRSASRASIRPVRPRSIR